MKTRLIFGISASKLGGKIWESGPDQSIIDRSDDPVELVVDGWLKTWEGKETGAFPPHSLVHIRLQRKSQKVPLVAFVANMFNLTQYPRLVTGEWFDFQEQP